MKEKLIYLFVAFCIVINTILIGTMVNDKAKAEITEETKNYQVGEMMVSDKGDATLTVNSCEFFSDMNDIFMKMNVSLSNIGKEKIEVSYLEDFKIEYLSNQVYPVDYRENPYLAENEKRFNGKYLYEGETKNFDLIFPILEKMNTSKDKNIFFRYSTFKEFSISVFNYKYIKQNTNLQFNRDTFLITYQDVDLDKTPSIYIGKKDYTYKIEEEKEEKTSKVSRSSRYSDKLIFASKTYEKANMVDTWRKEGRIATEKNYQINKKYKDDDNDFDLNLLDYTLLEDTDGFNYMFINFELKNLSRKEYDDGSFYDFGLKFKGGYDGELEYGRYAMGYMDEFTYNDYIVTPAFLNNEYVEWCGPILGYVIGAGETLKGQLRYNLGLGNYEGCAFSFVWFNDLKDIPYIREGKTEIRTIELVKRNSKITMDYKPIQVKKKEKEEIIIKEEPKPVVENVYYKIGDMVKGDKDSFNVINTKEIEDEEGYKYMIVNVEYTNLSKKNQTINFDSFSLNKKNGAYRSDITYYEKLGIEELSGEVGSGATISGNIIYDITNFAVGWGDTDNPKGEYEFGLSSIPNQIVEF